MGCSAPPAGAECDPPALETPRAAWPSSAAVQPPSHPYVKPVRVHQRVVFRLQLRLRLRQLRLQLRRQRTHELGLQLARQSLRLSAASPPTRASDTMPSASPQLSPSSFISASYIAQHRQDLPLTPTSRTHVALLRVRERAGAAVLEGRRSVLEHLLAAVEENCLRHRLASGELRLLHRRQLLHAVRVVFKLERRGKEAVRRRDRCPSCPSSCRRC